MTSLSSAVAAGPCQRIHSGVRVPWDSRPYFTVSDSRLPFLSPPTIRRATVNVFDPFYNFWANKIEISTSNSSSVFLCSSVAANMCLASRCLAMDYSGFQASCHIMILFQLVHCNVHYFIATLLHIVNFTKSTSASDVSRISAIARRRTNGSRSTRRSAIKSHECNKSRQKI
jgi:hypothetical protein